MSLFVATLLFGLLALAKGAALLWKGPALREPMLRSLRDDKIAYVVFPIAVLWFLWEVWTMGQAEAVFGDLTRPIMIIAGLVVLFGSFRWVKDFLMVRGAAIIGLILASKFLDAAFLQEPASRLVMVTGVYAMIVASLYLGTVPYRARDFYEWLFKPGNRSRVLGGSLAAYGLVVCLVALTY